MRDLLFYRFKAIFIIWGIPFLLMGCATRVNYSRMMPSDIDMSDSRNIAIFHVGETSGNSILSEKLDFWSVLFSLKQATKNKVNSSIKNESITMEKRVSDYATDLLTESLANTEYFEIIDPSEVQKQLEGKKISTQGQAKVGAMLGVDAVVVGTISRLKYEDTTFYVDQFYLDDEGKKRSRTLKRVKREFDFRMSYRVVKTGTSTVLAFKNFTDYDSDVEDFVDRDNLKDPEAVFKRMVHSFVRLITKQLAPYPIIESVSLLIDKAKDPRMKEAEEFVDNRLYDEALKVFLNIWNTTRNQAAGYNASIMYEVKRDLTLAEKMMNQVINYYPDKKNMRRLARLKRLESDLKKFNSQID